jgi:hypothetical protein
MMEHEAAQRIFWPRYDAMFVNLGSGGAEAIAFLLGKREAETPGRPRLVIEQEVARACQASEEKPVLMGWRGSQFD